MPRIWKDGRKVESSMPEYIMQLMNFADRMDERFSLHSDECGLIGDYVRNAANEIIRLSTKCEEI